MEKYGIPTSMDKPNDRDSWPKALVALGLTTLKVKEDLSVFPWGKPACTFQQTLSKASGYTKDALFSDEAMKTLRHAEQCYFKATNTVFLENLSNKQYTDAIKKLHDGAMI
jgi:hypothetical protein